MAALIRTSKGSCPAKSHQIPQSLPLASHATRSRCQGRFLRPILRQQKGCRDLPEESESQVSYRACLPDRYGSLV